MNKKLEEFLKKRSNNYTKLIEVTREECLEDLFFLSTGVLGLTDFTQSLHKPICQYLQNDGQRRKLLVIPRGHFKTSMEMARVIQILIKNPSERILWASSTFDNAGRCLLWVKDQFERNEWLHLLFPEIIPKDFRKHWNESEITVVHPGAFDGPSMDIIGVGGKVTGRHYTRMIFDDIFEIEASQSEIVADKIWDWYQYAKSLLDTPDCYIDVVGTRWGYNDLIERILDKERNQYEPVYPIMSAFDENGEPIFKERFKKEHLLQMQKDDPYKFSCQQLNNPSDPSVALFRVEWLKYYKREGDKITTDEGKVYRVGQLKITMTLDPAFSKKSSACEAAITVVGTASDGCRFLLDIWAGRPGVELMLQKALNMYELWNPLHFGIESNAAQKVLRPALNELYRSTGTFLPIRELTSHTKKDARIGALQKVFAQKNFYVEKSMSKFISQYIRFDAPGPRDILDSLQMHQDFWDPFPESSGDDSYKYERKGVSPITGY